MIKTVDWTNNKAYDQETIDKHSALAKKCICGALPLYGQCKIKLATSASELGIPEYELISVYNNIKSQRDINHGHFNESNRKQVSDRFEELVENMLSDPNKDLMAIRSFIKSIKSSFSYVYNIMKNSPSYPKLTEEGRKFIQKLHKANQRNHAEQTRLASEFEDDLASYIRSNGITNFRTEQEIRRDQDLMITPDILFNEPITIRVNGAEHEVNWIDAKNSTLMRTPFILRSIKKQVAKYTDAFGPGALVFHYGFLSGLGFNSAIILDGSVVGTNTQ